MHARLSLERLAVYNEHIEHVCDSYHIELFKLR